MSSSPGNRRPVKSRDNPLARRFAVWLSQRQITPNQISIASTAFAAFGALMLVAWSEIHSHAQWLLLLLVIVGIQGRLLCNLFDGMVAMEGGKSTPAGELFNDMPDRIADALLLIGAGYAAAIWWPAAWWLGWLGALLAIMTAYIRVLGASMDAPVRFLGPMAKQHRMAVLTAACVVSAVEPFWWPKGVVLTLAIVIIVIGSTWTCVRRTRAIHSHFSTHQAESAYPATPAHHQAPAETPAAREADDV